MSVPLSFLETIKELHKLDTLVFLDFETFYKTKGTSGNKSYSMKSLPYHDYILGERFQTLGVSIAEDDSDFDYIIQPEDIQEAMAEIKQRRAEGERIGLVCHNTQFDGSICNWVFGTKFDFYFCTQLMRTLLNPHRSASLKACALDLWPDDETMHKGGEELQAVDGVKFEYITDEQHEALGKYAVRDGEIARNLFIVYYAQIVSMGIEREIGLMHITLRGAIEPQFVLDEYPLDERIGIEIERQDRLFSEAFKLLKDKYNIDDVDRKTFSSDKQYTQLLRDLSVPIPRKYDKKKKKEMNALGQSDPSYLQMVTDHPQFAPLFAARKVAKSNLALSRAHSFKHTAQLFNDRAKNANQPFNMPFYLKYYGADQTGRWSGNQGLNQQNMPADRGGDGSEGHHRRSLTLPDGMQVSVVDLSNIEVRVNMWFCGQHDVLDKMQSTDHLPDGHEDKYDYYCDVGGGIYNRTIVKGVDKFERQVSKAAGLQLGFGTTAGGFKEYLESGPLGMDPILEPLSFSENIKRGYERKHPMVVRMWRFLDRVVIPAIVNDREVRFGPNDSFIARREQIELPSGRILRYPGADWTHNGRATFHSGLFYADGRPVLKNLWFGLVMNNCVQGSARDVIGQQKVDAEAMLQENNYGHVIGSVHDEILSALYGETVEVAHNAVSDLMRIPPAWAPDLPLDVSGGYAPEYSK